MEQERPEMDDFERKKHFWCFNILKKCWEKNFSLILFQKLHKIFLHILLFQNILSIFFERKKIMYFYRVFYVFPYIIQIKRCLMEYYRFLKNLDFDKEL